MTRKVLLGIFSLALVLLSFSGFQAAYADDTASVTDSTDDLKIGASWHNAPPQFYLDFVDITEASVSLQNDEYTFTVTVVGQVLPLNPDFTSKIGAPIGRVHYHWALWDSSGNRLGAIYVIWYDGLIWAAAHKALCESPYGCDNEGGLQINISQDGQTLWVKMSQSELVDFYGTQPVKWKHFVNASFETDVLKQLKSCDGLWDYAPDGPPIDLPT
jgi:hypothetical protein